MVQSRLSKNLEKKTKKQLFVTILIIIGVLFFLIKFGVPLFVNFSLFLTGINSKPADSTQNQQKKEFIAPPILNKSFSATNSATISIFGNALGDQTVLLYLNNELVDTTQVKDDKTFKFENVPLKDGQNEIKTKAKIKDTESDFSDLWTITYQKGNPNLSVDNPQDGQSFKDQDITVSGKTDANNLITVNGYQAIVDNVGNYQYTLHLQNGDNDVKVVATDQAGNKTEKTLKVTYSN